MRITSARPSRLRPRRLRSGACERAMTRDGTVGRSDATETNLASHRDIDPVRVMRTRFADPIRASSLFGLHQQAGHMTASDLCAARQKSSLARRGPSTHEAEGVCWIIWWGGGVANRGRCAAAGEAAHYRIFWCQYACDPDPM